ncbi:MAG: DUF4956 domain-containing protein, partial [Planctomycetota bacterium]|nr:DUF4956 domain-containing protein [Planctomycetota bacterium]
FMVLGMTTMIIISVVKSSLALSLGLVGALSIVRFRSAIKEPEELTYIFLVIAIGLGMGASQAAFTAIGFVSVLIALFLQRHFNRVTQSPNLVLTISSQSGTTIDIKSISQLLAKHCRAVDLRRFNEAAEGINAAFVVSADNLDEIVNAQEELKQTYKDLKISFLDNAAAF